MSLNWNFQGGEGFKPQKKNLRGGSIDIFWNNTITLSNYWTRLSKLINIIDLSVANTSIILLADAECRGKLIICLCIQHQLSTGLV